MENSDFIGSFLRNDLIEWVGMYVRPSVHPSVNIFCFFYFLSCYWAVYFEISHVDTRDGYNHSDPDFAISEGYPKKLISYAVEALSLAHSRVLSLQIIYK